MITQFKLYEYFGEPVVDDYVICTIDETKFFVQPDLATFIDNNIGRIAEIVKDEDADILEDVSYFVYYENIPSNLSKSFKFQARFPYDPFFKPNCGRRTMQRSEVTHWSRNKQELIEILNAKKFGI